MEVHCFQRRPMYLGFCGGDAPKQSRGDITFADSKPAGGQHGFDIAQMPVRLLGRVLDIQPQGAEAVAGGFRESQVNLGQAQR